MNDEMKEVSLTGIVSRTMDQYVITSDDGTEYKLSAIMPWEAVPVDFESGDFALHLGKRMTAAGLSDGHTIWRAVLSETSKTKDRE
nr:MAG: hypothetical protein AM325_02445 [Candidatus Thorarchaeota archaeon SMTZ1-45]